MISLMHMIFFILCVYFALPWYAGNQWFRALLKFKCDDIPVFYLPALTEQIK